MLLSNWPARDFSRPCLTAATCSTMFGLCGSEPDSLASGIVAAVRGNGERQVEGMAGSAAFRANRLGRCGFPAGSAIIPPAPIVLGSDYNHGGYAVVAGCGPHRFLAALPRHGTRRATRRDRSRLLRTPRPCFRSLHFPAWTPLRANRRRSTRISLRRNYPGDCAVNPYPGSGIANRLSSLRRSFHRHCGRVNIRLGLAGKRTSRSVKGFFPHPCVTSAYPDAPP